MVGMSAADKKALHDFGKKASELKRALDGTNAYRNDLLNRLRYMKEAALQTSAVDQNIVKDIISLEKRLTEVSIKLNGDATLARREFETPTSISNRIANIMEGVISSTEAPTNIAINSYNISAQQFAPLLAEVKAVGDEVKRIENLLEKSGAPYTPGRVPDWKL
jgi:chromosome segregation ATPase